MPNFLRRFICILALTLLPMSLFAMDPVRPTASARPNILLFGKPSSGKGTFSDFLTQYGYSHFSLGDHVKYHIKMNTVYGQKFAPLLVRALEQCIAPDSLIGEARDDVFRLMAEYIAMCKQENKPFILDNPIHSQEDVDYLLNLLKELQVTNLAIVHLTIDSSMLMARASARRVCPHCYAIYGIVVKPPVRENFCDTCNHELTRRPEDAPELYSKRLSYHADVIAPAVAGLIYSFTQQQIPVHTFDVNQPIAECIEFYRTLLSQ